MNFAGFLIASAVSRSARLLITVGPVGWRGKAIVPVIKKYFNWSSLDFIIFLIGGFLVIKWLH